MTNKEKYRQFCEQNDVPVFMQPWWMEAVCAGKDWDVLLSENHEKKIRAVMPFLIRERWHVKYIVMPKQTQVGGIWVSDDVQDTVEMEAICTEFKRKIDEMGLSYYYQQFPIYSPCIPILQKLGMKTAKRITYRLDDLSDLDEVIDGFSKNKKRQLVKAAALSVDYTMEAEEFYRFHVQCMAEKGRRISYSREFFLVLYLKAMRQNCGQIICLKNTEQEVVAAAFVVWDKWHLYYLIPCFSQKYKNSGAGALLALESIKLAKKMGRSFDFEGSNDRNIANHYQQFGSTPTVYYAVYKYYNPLFAIALLINRIRNWKVW